MGPVEVVQCQLDAYNAHDLAAFLATYTDTADLHVLPAANRADSPKACLAAFSLPLMSKPGDVWTHLGAQQSPLTKNRRHRAHAPEASHLGGLVGLESWVRPEPSIERTPRRRFRALWPGAHVDRRADRPGTVPNRMGRSM